MLDECRSVEHYEKLNRISEGTYGVVYRWVGGIGGLDCCFVRGGWARCTVGKPMGWH